MTLQRHSNSQMHRSGSQGKVSTSEADTVDRSGGAIMALLQQAADIAREDCERAQAMAHELSLRLKAAEDRSEKLQAQVKQLETKVAHAEHWLARVYNEIDSRFFKQQRSEGQRAAS
jgi:septal ring factor EnvC (AmiA/AmiB activator)